MPETLSSQELLALESVSSLSLYGDCCQLPDATVTSGWHSLRRLDFYGYGEDDSLEQAFDAILAMPHLEYLGCYVKALPAQFSALSKLRELGVGFPHSREVYRSLQVSHPSFLDYKSLYHKWR